MRAEYPFAPRWLDVPDGRLHYVDEGPRGAEAVLCVHGNPTWSFLFRRVIAGLSPSHRVVAIDHLGCGLSDKPRGGRYTLAGHAENLERLALALGLERVTLLVHDWGGPIGLGFARRRPELVGRLAITNTAAFPARVPLRIRACRAPIVGELLVRGANAFALAATRMALSDPARLSSAAREGLLAPYDSWANRIAIARFVEDIPVSERDPSWGELAEIERFLPRLAALPACVVWGVRDWCFTPAMLAEWRRRLPRAEVHELDVGHWLYEEAPEEVLAILARFLRERPAGAVAGRSP